MVREQILRRGIDEPRLLEAFLSVPRHAFVDEALSARAYGDSALPIGAGQTLSQPYIVARMVQLGAPQPGQRVLEIGTGSGYQAAILARLGAEVFTVERHAILGRRAAENWERAGVSGITQKIADGTLGWARHSPFDVILVGAAAPAVPMPLLRQLSTTGRMIVPVGSAVRQILKRLTRTDDGAQVEDFDSCSFVRLIGRAGFDA